jgi:uncharacterized protein YutE (UPF0331/DUF86 family)
MFFSQKIPGTERQSVSAMLEHVKTDSSQSFLRDAAALRKWLA